MEVVGALCKGECLARAVTKEVEEPKGRNSGREVLDKGSNYGGRRA